MSTAPIARWRYFVRGYDHGQARSWTGTAPDFRSLFAALAAIESAGARITRTRVYRARLEAP